MTSIPEGLMYTKTHEWYKIDCDVVTVGITDYAQSQLTDIVYIDLPSVGSKKKAGETLLTIESVISAEDIFSPLDREATEINKDLSNTPEAVNKDSYSNWMVKLKRTGGTVESMEPAQYKKFIGD